MAWAAIGGEIVGARSARPSEHITRGPENGCVHHADCFTCPYADCILEGGAETAKRYACELCGQVTASRGNLRSHIRGAHGHGFEHLADE